MKKALLLIIICLTLTVKADITDSQAHDVASFARNLIIKGLSSEHIDSKGMPIIVYKQGPPRIYGYQDKLSYIDDDYFHTIAINSNKWAFDCSSFTSYVLKKTLNINLLDSNYLGGNPYMVNKYETDRIHFKSIGKDDSDTVGMTEYELMNLKSSLKEGDLIVIVGRHIAMYIGNNELAESTPGYIGKYSSNNKIYQGAGLYNLGIGITNLDSFINDNMGKDLKFMILRIRDGIVDKSIVPNTTITWPDTLKVEDLKDQKVNSETKIDIKLSTIDYTKELDIDINITNNDGLNAYSFGKENKANYLSINNVSNYKLNTTINENGIYYLFVKDINGKEINRVMEITNIDNNEPIIDKIEYQEGKIIVIAHDDKTKNDELLYSFNNGEYQSSSVFNINDNGTYFVKVKDKVGNVKEEKIEVNDFIKSSISRDNIYIKCLIVLVVILFLMVIYKIIITKRRLNNN